MEMVFLPTTAKYEKKKVLTLCSRAKRPLTVQRLWRRLRMNLHFD